MPWMPGAAIPLISNKGDIELTVASHLLLVLFVFLLLLFLLLTHFVSITHAILLSLLQPAGKHWWWLSAHAPCGFQTVRYI